MRFRLLKDASLSTTVLLLVAGAFFCLILLVLASVVWITRRESDRAVLRDFRVTDTFLLQTLRDRTDSMQAVCASLGSRPGVISNLMRSGEAGTDWATVSEAADEIRQQVDAQDVVITDPQGRALGETGGDLRDAGHPFTAQPGVAAAMRGSGWKGIVSYKGHLAVTVSVPIHIPGQPYLLGTISAFAQIGKPLCHSVAQALNCEVAFVVHGVIASQSVELNQLPEIPNVREGDTFVLPSVLTSGGAAYRGSYRNVRLTPDSEPLGVLILRPAAKVMTLSHDLEEGLVGPFVISLLLALVAGAAVARRITQPLDGIVRAARELREGRWPQLFPVERGDEIGLLQTVFNEMTIALRLSQERLLSLIDTDPLTEMDNHRRFQDRLAQEIKRIAESGEALSLLILDIDYFQEFNQKFGHRRGDEALKLIAKCLRANLPAYALIARYGGEEFAILAPRHAAGEAAPIAEGIRETIEKSAIGVTVSIGFAETQRGIAEPESLTLAAELAVTQAKQLGRNRVCGFDTVLGEVGVGADSHTGDTLHLHRFLRDGNLATVQALAAAVDAKDPYTQGHSRRVADLALRTARRCGLTTAEADLIFVMGTLHDVGKIGVPDRVLQKTGKLDGEERQLMETHPVLGELIVGKVPQLARVLPGIRSHHERWDGRGYPDGLTGEQIPVVARILALADTYDAITSDRPYRKGLAPEVALSEITRCAGLQFDPELVPLFLEVAQTL